MAELNEQPLIMEGQGWADYGLVDFHVDPAVEVEVDTGELEMF